MECLRIAKEWSQSDAARFAAKKYPHITRNVIVHLEAGKTRDPKPPLLRAFADLYSAPYEEIALHFFRDKYGIEGLQATEARTKTGRPNLLETRTSPVTDSEEDQKATQPTSSTSEDPVAGTAAVRSSEHAQNVKAAHKLYRYAAAVSAVADGLMHSWVAGRDPGITKRSRSRKGVPSGTGRHAGRGSKR